VVLVRHPVKSVRQSDEADRLPVRLAIGVIAALGTVGLVWLIGHVGYRLGFAPLMRVPHLADAPVGGLATGVAMLLRAPGMVFEAGLARPEWLMVAFAMIAIPAAGLTAARPRRPGGPKAPALVDVFAVLGAVGAGLNTVALVAWVTSPFRQELLRSLPFSPSEAIAWSEDLRIAAGLDVLAVVICALWVVLVMRLPIPLWLRAIAASASIFVLALATVGMAISNATAAEVHARRSVCLDEEHASLHGRLLLGVTQHEHAMLRVDGNVTLVELRPGSEPISIIGTQSVESFLRDQARSEE
jgi:hypothetical protein